MSALEGLPDNVTEIGNVSISLFMGEDGVSFAYGYEGISREAALGYLQVVMDRLRDDAAMDWVGKGHSCLGPECPQCGFTLEEDEDGDE